MYSTCTFSHRLGHVRGEWKCICTVHDNEGIEYEYIYGVTLHSSFVLKQTVVDIPYIASINHSAADN